ncbi:hypothetical protein J8273_7286 [Carpediemonas membranifera]|uniref:Uncharacterized protein n=1 Tax=Carpediemonas membranifera TaxID=201153 RepID=A0A8J6E1S7_9EUKA|nr:hypothetical protein J8273_7286 [Carpediemonas membranifera]|eukprot:KAG9391012.1 hypothetical protein J8273_7286 [Carpediemonas membranifera]
MAKNTPGSESSTRISGGAEEQLSKSMILIHAQKKTLMLHTVKHGIFAIPLLLNTLGWIGLCCALIYPDTLKAIFTLGGLLCSLVAGVALYPLIIMLAAHFARASVTCQSRAFLVVYLAVELAIFLHCLWMAFGFFFAANGLTSPIYALLVLLDDITGSDSTTALIAVAVLVGWTLWAFGQAVTWLLAAAWVVVIVRPVIAMTTKGPMCIDA